MRQFNRSNLHLRAGSSAVSPVVVTLLSGILLAIVVLIIVVVTSTGSSVKNEHTGSDDNDNAIGEGTTAHRRELKSAPQSSKPVGDPNRIIETLKPGRTYRVVVKAGMSSRVEDRDWGVNSVVSLAYAAELVINRKIESNDGKRIVEVRNFEVCRNAKILANVDELTIEFGLPGELFLVALETYAPGSTGAVDVFKPLLESVLRSGAQAALQDSATKTFAHIDSLSGKTVRIVYIDDVESGVDSIEPIACSLSSDERDFLFNTAVLSDCHLMNLSIAPGGDWKVDGSQFSGFMDPSLRGNTAGEIVIERFNDATENGRQVATLKIARGLIEIDDSDASHQRIGRFVPTGTMKYRIGDSYIESANLRGDFRIDQVSTDHLLFEARFKATPTLEVQYSCELQ